MKDINLEFTQNKHINAKKFEQWKIDSLKLSTVVRTSDREELIELTKDFLSRFQITLQNCYETALHCSIQCRDVDFILGYVIRGKFGIITAHAWNKYKDTEFDLLQELHLDSHIYYKIVEITSKEIAEIALSEDWFEDYTILKHYYEKYVAADEDFVTVPVGPADITVLAVIRGKWKNKI